MKLTFIRGLAIFCYVCISCLPLSGQTCTATGPKDASVSSDNTTVGTVAWLNAVNAETSNLTYASAVKVVSIGGHATSHYLLLQNFGFSFANTDVICGILVKITRHVGGLGIGSSVKDNSVVLMSGTTPSVNDYADHSTAWGNSDGTVNYGGMNDQWGALSNWTASQVNSANFGVALSTTFNGGVISLTLTAFVDEISVTIYGHTSTGLAITMERFAATTEEQSALLTWTASSTDNLDEFTIERSADSRSWQDIGSVTALPGQNQYAYKDVNPLTGSNYYRLLLENHGAAPTYSIIQEVFFEGTGKRVSVYPNPVMDRINISSVTPIGRIILRDVQGRVLRSMNAAGGTFTQQVPVSSLAKGIYLLQVDQQVFEILKQ